MKNIYLVSVVLITTSLMLFSSCQKRGGKNMEQGKSSSWVDEIKNEEYESGGFISSQEMTAYEEPGSENESSGQENTAGSSKSTVEKYDLDFTKLNYNLASAQIFNILIDTESFLGKTVRIKGKFNTSEMDGERLFSVLYYDATACCQTGLGFIDQNRTFPQDYPEMLEDIEVTGVLKVKDMHGADYIYIDCNAGI